MCSSEPLWVSLYTDLEDPDRFALHNSLLPLLTRLAGCGPSGGTITGDVFPDATG